MHPRIDGEEFGPRGSVDRANLDAIHVLHLMQLRVTTKVIRFLKDRGIVHARAPRVNQSWEPRSRRSDGREVVLLGPPPGPRGLAPSVNSCSGINVGPGNLGRLSPAHLKALRPAP